MGFFVQKNDQYTLVIRRPEGKTLVQSPLSLHICTFFGTAACASFITVEVNGTEAIAIAIKESPNKIACGVFMFLMLFPFLNFEDFLKIFFIFPKTVYLLINLFHFFHFFGYFSHFFFHNCS